MDEKKYFKLLEWGKKVFFESISGYTFEDFCSEAFLENPELDLESLKSLAKKKKNEALKEQYETTTVHVLTKSSKNDYHVGWLFDKKQDPVWYKSFIEKSRKYSKKSYHKNKDNIEWYKKRLEKIKLWYADKIANDEEFRLKRKSINRAGIIKHRKKIKENPNPEKIKIQREKERKIYAEKMANDEEFRLRTKKRLKENQEKVKKDPDKLKAQKEKKRKWLKENMEYCQRLKK